MANINITVAIEASVMSSVLAATSKKMNKNITEINSISVNKDYIEVVYSTPESVHTEKFSSSILKSIL